MVNSQKDNGKKQINLGYDKIVSEYTISFLQSITNTLFSLIAIVITVIAVGMFIYYTTSIIDGTIGYLTFLEKMFTIFLLIEVATAIKIYFREKYHFPLNFFFYIALTDITRHIIIHINEPNFIIKYSIAILLIIGALSLHNWFKNGV